MKETNDLKDEIIGLTLKKKLNKTRHSFRIVP
jgi:hypothetical protein